MMKYEAMVLSCMDPRFQPKVFKYLKAKKLTGKYSSFTIAGAAIGVTHKKFKKWHSTFIDNLSTSIKLHKINKLIVINHKDCGAAKIVNGKITANLAIEESSHHKPAETNLSAKKDKNDFIINGKKIFVIDGASADLLIVLTRTSGEKGDLTGLTLFVIDISSPGIDIVKLDMADSRNYANISFNDVKIDASCILGDIEAGGEIAEDILDIGRIAISSEMLGNAESAFETTIDYLKQRKQFGVLIGSFQALQHRAAEMFCELELTKSSVMAAMRAADEKSNELQRLSSLAKTVAGETLHLVSNEAIQMHGGIGVTDEYDIGFFLKRARVAEQIFGNSKYHTERYANLSGF